MLAARLPAGALGNLLAISPALLRTLSTYTGGGEPDAPHDKRYIDRLKITARAGKGGNGCVSFYQGASRGKHATADGGSGGDGGNVVVRATASMKSLAGVQQLYKAEAGLHGTRQRQHGRAGRDTVVLVPVGTVVQRLAAEPGVEGTEGGGGGAGSRRSRGGGAGSTPAAAAGVAGGQQAGAGAEAGAGAGAGAGGDEELPEWLRRWRRPFTGANYSSGDDDGGSSEVSDIDLEAEVAAAAAAAASAGRGLPEPDWAADDASGGGVAAAVQQREQQQYQVLADLTEAGQEVVVARGGAGGRGNAGMKARAHRPAPAESERGAPGQVSRLLLELKLLADVGLVGLPNAGKSTLLRALTAATPRVGDYAFTTLAPQLGVVPAPSPADDPLIIADIPGLIRGAHENRGLGHNFLRHIERTKALAYVLDCASGSQGRPGPKCWEQLELLQQELEAYSPRLSRLPALVVANKVELLSFPARTLTALGKRTQLPIVALSAKEQYTLQPAGVPFTGPAQAAAEGRPTQDANQQRLQQRQRQKQQYEWMEGLHPLHYRLELLLHEAGARQYAPDWAEFKQAAVQRQRQWQRQ